MEDTPRLHKQTKYEILEDLINEKASQVKYICDEIERLNWEIDEVKTFALQHGEIIGKWKKGTKETLFDINKEKKVLQIWKNVLRDEIIELYEVIELIEQTGE